MQMHSPQAVLFDLDGTLIDTAPDFASVLNRQLLAHGRSPIPYKAVRTAVSQGSRAVVELGFGDRFSLDSDEFEAIRQEFLSHYLIHLADETRLFPGMDELLSHLETREIPWGIVTNKPSLYTLPLLKALNLDQRCSVAICPDMVTHTKPHPAPMFKAADALGVAADKCVYVGDHQRDIEAGKRASMITVAVSYGYIQDNDSPANWEADYLVDTVFELSRLLGLE